MGISKSLFAGNIINYGDVLLILWNNSRCNSVITIPNLVYEIMEKTNATKEETSISNAI